MRFDKILIANRGEIARRIIRTLRKLGRKTVAVYSEADREALHVTDADESFLLGPAEAALSYLHIEKLVSVALTSGASAIHPGYGFLSESKEFSSAVQKAGLHFIGPSPETLEILGEKHQARMLAESLGIPVSRGGLLQDLSVDALTKTAAPLRFPLLIKAVSGGGGRGMRVVSSLDQLLEVAPAASREAQQFFGSGSLILEEFFAPARQVEGHLLGVKFGEIRHFYERDCSTQRRNQKVIEEAPARNLSQELREKLYASALALGKAGKLCGLATAEFLVKQPECEEFIFLEVNPRIQVEHPVTEMITGVDLVEQHLLVAEGHPLQLPQEAISLRGHAIQARVYAEIPELDFSPSGGKIETLLLPEEMPCLLRIEHSLRELNFVDTFYDALLIKEIAWGRNFSEAKQNLFQALQRTEVCGVANNLRFLEQLLQSETFLDATITVQYLSENPPEPVGEEEAHLALVVALLKRFSEGKRRFQKLNRFRSHSLPERVKAVNQVMPIRPNGFLLKSRLRNKPFALQVEEAMSCDENENSFITLKIRGNELRETYRACISESGIEILSHPLLSSTPQNWTPPHPLGSDSTSFTLAHQDWQLTPAYERISTHENASAADGLFAPFPGTVIKIEVSEGQTVEAGQLVLILESMKTEHRLYAPQSGKVQELRAQEKLKVSTGDLLCRVR